MNRKLENIVAACGLTLLLFLVVGPIGVALSNERQESQGAAVLSVGLLVPLSGDYAALGFELLKGVELALKSQETDRRSVRMIVADIGSLSTRDAVSAAQKLLKHDRIDLGITPFASDAQLFAQAFQSNGTPLVTLWDSTDQLLSVGDQIFSTGFSTELTGAMTAEMARNILGLRSVSIVSHLDGWSSPFASSFINRFTELAGRVISHQELDRSTTDFRTPIARIKSEAPDGVLFPLVTAPSVFIRQARTAGLRSQLLTGDTMLIPGELDTAGVLAEGIHFTAAWVDPVSKLRALLQSKQDEGRTHQGQDFLAVSLGYEGMSYVLEGIDIALYQKISIRAGLEQTLGVDRKIFRLPKIFKVNRGRAIEVPQAK